MGKIVQRYELPAEEFFKAVIDASQGYYTAKAVKGCTFYRYIDEDGNHIELILKEEDVTDTTAS